MDEEDGMGMAAEEGKGSEGGDGEEGKERRRGRREKIESFCVCSDQSQSPAPQIAFSFTLIPGKGPIKIAPIGNGSVIATGSL